MTCILESGTNEMENEDNLMSPGKKNQTNKTNGGLRIRKQNKQDKFDHKNDGVIDLEEFRKDMRS